MLEYKKGETKWEKYKLGTFTISDLVQKIPACSDAVKYLQQWVKLDEKEKQKWLNDYPECAEWAIKNGFIEEDKKNWNGLELEFRKNGNVGLIDGDSKKVLLRFEKDGKVMTIIEANGGNGKFDNSGRLIITND